MGGGGVAADGNAAWRGGHDRGVGARFHHRQLVGRPDLRRLPYAAQLRHQRVSRALVESQEFGGGRTRCTPARLSKRPSGNRALSRSCACPATTARSRSTASAAPLARRMITAANNRRNRAEQRSSDRLPYDTTLATAERLAVRSGHEERDDRNGSANQNRHDRRDDALRRARWSARPATTCTTPSPSARTGSGLLKIAAASAARSAWPVTTNRVRSERSGPGETLRFGAAVLRSRPGSMGPAWYCARFDHRVGAMAAPALTTMGASHALGTLPADCGRCRSSHVPCRGAPLTRKADEAIANACLHGDC